MAPPHDEDRLPTYRSDGHAAITVSPAAPANGHQAPIAYVSSASSSSSSNSNTDDSEESYLDSLEEGRTPLLGDDEDAIATRRHRGQHDSAHYDGERTLRGVHRFPKERRKTVLAVLLVIMAGSLNDIVLSWVHDLIPSTPPLPDIVFSITPYVPWALRVSEYIMIGSFATLMLLILMHKHRWIVLRRLSTIGALLYLGRCVTMFVTQVPKADVNYYCSPKLDPANRTLGEVILRGMISTAGLAINGKYTLCGDYIYSGHTLVLVCCYLFIKEYSPRRWKLLHYTSALASTIGVLGLIISRGHYTIDVVLAYYISTTVFWQYHTLTSFAVLRQERQPNNHMKKMIWYSLFKYMEGNVLRPLPHKYGMPFPIERLRRLRWPKFTNQQ